MELNQLIYTPFDKKYKGAYIPIISMCYFIMMQYNEKKEKC
jgi:hypothetical protein